MQTKKEYLKWHWIFITATMSAFFSLNKLFFLVGPKSQEIPEGWGIDGQIKFQMVQSDSVPTYSCSC